jgi:hypothetical protein
MIIRRLAPDFRHERIWLVQTQIKALQAFTSIARPPNPSLAPSHNPYTSPLHSVSVTPCPSVQKSLWVSTEVRLLASFGRVSHPWSPIAGLQLRIAAH